MNNGVMESSLYSVAFAERRDIGEEWNHVKWGRNLRQFQYHRLYYPTSGSAKLRLTNTEIELVPGNVYFIPAFSVAESSIKGKMNKYYIHFQVNSYVFEMYKCSNPKYFSPARPETEYLFNTVIENYADNSVASRLKLQGAMNLIMSDFVQDMEVDMGNFTRFEPVLRYVDDHFRENISLSELATIMNISTMYFSNYFKQTFNISPKQYILNKRLTESQRLLLETELTVKEIAYAVGFENENYFSEFFTSKVGISARRFRKRQIPTSVESIF